MAVPIAGQPRPWRTWTPGVAHARGSELVPAGGGLIRGACAPLFLRHQVHAGPHQHHAEHDRGTDRFRRRVQERERQPKWFGKLTASPPARLSASSKTPDDLLFEADKGLARSSVRAMAPDHRRDWL